MIFEGLFHRAISQSGTSINPWVMHTQKTAKSQALKLGRDLNCMSNSTAEVIKCLQTKNPEEIINMSQKWLLTDSILLPHFKPVVEPKHAGAFLIEDPIETMKAGRAADVPWLNGVNSDEGALAVARMSLFVYNIDMN